MTRLRILLVASLMIVGIAAAVTVQAVGPCLMAKSDLVNGVKYSASYSTTVYTGTPTTVCLNGEPVYEVSINVSGNNGSSGSATALVCSILDTAVTVTDSAGKTHTFAPRSGQDWSDVHTGNCRNLSWTF